MNIKAMRKSYTDLFNHTYEWFITMNFPPVLFCGSCAERTVKTFLKKFQKKERVDIFGIGVLVMSDNPHCHFGLMSKERPYTRRLSDVTIWPWLMRWPYTFAPFRYRANIKIQVVDHGTSENIAHYMANKRNMDHYKPDSWKIVTYRPNYLKNRNAI